MERKRDDQTRIRRRTNDVMGVAESEPEIGGHRNGTRRSEGEAPGTSESERSPGGKESSTHPLGCSRDRDRGRERDRKGGWTNSYEGSAAKRRADEVLARIAALEVSFDRVEEERTAIATPPANAVRGGGAPEFRAGRARNNAASALDAPSAAGASTSDDVAPMSIPDMAGETLNVNYISWCLVPLNSQSRRTAVS